MAFGAMFKNETGSVIIDSDNPPLSVARYGYYPNPNNATAARNIVFSAPITTVEPPLIFINPDTTNYRTTYRDAVLTGGPGNWTGFRLYGGVSASTASPGFRWMVGTFINHSSYSGFGLRLFGSSGEPVYSSDVNIISLTGTSTNEGWNWEGFSVSYGGIQYNASYIPWTGDSEDYFLASSLIGGSFYSGFQAYEVWAGFKGEDRSRLILYVGVDPTIETRILPGGRTVFSAKPARPLSI